MLNLTRFFVSNSKLTAILSLFMIIIGLQGIRKMTAESFPNIDFGFATVTTIYKGASTEDVEIKITKPIEDELRSVTGVKDIQSVSQSGRSTIKIRVDIDEANVNDVMSDLQKAVDRVSNLPTDLKESPKFKEINSKEFPAIEIALIGNNDNRYRDLMADELKELIEDNKDVLNVRLTGFKKRRFNINLDIDKLNSHHIGIKETISKIKSRNTNKPSGSIRQNDDQQLIRIEGKVKSSKELSNVLIRSNFSGNKVFLKDIAETIDGMEDAKTLARYNGREATLLIITKKAGTDTIKIVDDINKRLIYFKKRVGDKLEITIYANESLKVKNKLDVLFNNAISGLALVIIFLLIFLPGVVGLMASISLPLAVLTTFGVMSFLGMTLNSVTILALVIALGMLVDNSVVITENYNRLREDGIDSLQAILKSVGQLWLPITSTALTTIAAFMPMMVTRGVMGQVITAIPIIVSSALLISLIESFFFLPMRLVLADKRKTLHLSTKDSPTKKDWFQKVIIKFELLMDVIIRHRYISLVIFFAVIIVSLLMSFVANKFILFPAEQTEIYIARIELNKDARIEHTDLALSKLSKQIKDTLGKKAVHIIARSGSSTIDPTDQKGGSGNNLGLILIYVDDDTKFNTPHTEVLSTLRSIKNEELKNITFEAKINGPPVGEPINATFRSNDLKSLTEVTDIIIEKLSKVDGIHSLKYDRIIGSDEIFIEMDYIQADTLGIDINSAGDGVRSAVSGKKISTVTLNNKEVELYIRLKESNRTSIDDLKKIKIMDGRGNLIPLHNFASFKKERGTQQIRRFDFKRSKTLTGIVDDNIITEQEANNLLKEKYDEISDRYPEVSMVFGGAGESTKESISSLKDAFFLSLIGIFAILVFLFKSYMRPLIIMSTIPLGLFGFSIAFYLHSKPISFLALIGVIGLGGIIVNAGIVLISFIDEMRATEQLSLHEILVKASGMRLKAVLVTSLTTISGLIPTAYGIGGSDAILVPMTMAMAWGLTSGTILTIIWVPCAYAIIEDISNLATKAFKRNKTALPSEL